MHYYTQLIENIILFINRMKSKKEIKNNINNFAKKPEDLKDNPYSGL